jgi:hypothetical protein
MSPTSYQTAPPRSRGGIYTLLLLLRQHLNEFLLKTAHFLIDFIFFDNLLEQFVEPMV